MLDLTALVERLGVKRPASSELPARRPAPLRRAPFPRHEFAAAILDQVGAAIAARDIAVAMYEPFVHVESLEDIHVVVLPHDHLRNLPARRPRGRLDRLPRHELAAAILDQFLLAIPAVDCLNVPAQVVLALFDPDSQVLAILTFDD